jgi:DNA helicase-2/ATP-dependent DNA helicase PcrA
VNTPARGIGDSTLDKLAAWARPQRLGVWETLKAGAADDADAPAGGGPDLGSGPRKKLAAFVELMNQLREAAPTLGVAGLAEKVLEDSGYRDALAAESSLEAEGRMENLLELVAQMREYEREAEEPSLTGFLERIALASDVDGYDPDKGAVSLMTVHTAKGLEFPWVFLTGLEENIFPHARSVDDDAAIEEERRLCYVAVTRAMRRLFLTRVRRRRLSGQELPGIPSRFLRDLPAECLELIVQPRPAYMQVDTSEAGPWAGRWNRDVYLDNDRVGGGNRFGSGARRNTPAGRSIPPPRTAKPAAPRPPTGQITVEYDEDAGGGGDEMDGSQLGLRIGARLRHPQFGVGEVRGWQSAGADLKVTMRFPSAGVKTILARFLTRV